MDTIWTPKLTLRNRPYKGRDVVLSCILSWLTKWQPLSIFISALATIVLAVVAIFQDRLRALVSRPKLDLLEGPFYPDSELVPVTHKKTGEWLADACYLQIRVTNKGRSPAEMVEVFIAKLEKKTGGSFRKRQNFYPMNLKWRHREDPNAVFLPRLSPHTTRDCTLGRIVEPARKQKAGDHHGRLKLPHDRSPFRLELSVTPNTRSDLLSPGEYRLFLEIGASNTSRAKKRIVELEFSGEWLPNPRDMATATPI